MIFWHKWQAPSFIVMAPSKFRRFDAAKVWERNDPAVSSDWLQRFEEDYALRLESQIQAAAGQMAVEWAKERGIVESAPQVAGPVKTHPGNSVPKASTSRQQLRKLATPSAIPQMADGIPPIGEASARHVRRLVLTTDR
jgi:hypothetical protein